MQTDLDPNFCIDANEGLNGVEEVFCKIKDCKPCEFGVAELGAFKWEIIINTTIVAEETPYESTYRYMAVSENSCGAACGSVAGCTGFIWADEKCDLIMRPFVTDDNAEGPLVTVGKLSEYCGEKFYQDVVQTSSFTITLPGYAAHMKALIDSIMEAEVNSADGAGKWRFREEDRVFYSVMKYYESEGDNISPTTKIFVREKVGSEVEENRRKRREVPQNNMPPIPDDVEIGEIGEPTVTTGILSENGDTIGTCDENEICTCIDGYELTGKKSCDDINECETEKDTICGGVIAGTCSNTAGSFECYCNSGFTHQNETCFDIDECEEPDNCNENGFECKNREGSFDCVCQTGFESVSTMGQDGVTNECIWPEWSEWSEWSNNCNTEVGPGLRQRSCSVTNACEGQKTQTRVCVDYCSTFGCSDLCDQTDGHPVCSCTKENEILAPDGKTCENSICPGAGACWTYDELEKKCRMKPGCSELSCYSESLTVSFDPLLFGYKEEYEWASEIKPTFNKNSSRFEFTTKLSQTSVSNDSSITLHRQFCCILKDLSLAKNKISLFLYFLDFQKFRYR